MANRTCPNCQQASIPVAELLVTHATCPNCRAIVGPHWSLAAISFIVIFTVTIIATIVVLAQFGIYAAILFFSFPIGALGYLKARFAPLVVKNAAFDDD